MKPQQAKRLGNYLKKARTASGLSAMRLADAAGTTDATILRYESGEFLNPAPETLAQIAQALDLPLEDVLRRADYPVPELPAVKPYLRTKFDQLPEDAVDRIEKYMARVAKEHGVDIHGPAPGEDEEP